MRNIPFSPPDITELEIQEVCEALRSGWITTGPRTKQLEKELAEYCHVAKLVCLNSATAAEEMNLRVLGIGEGDEVLVPAYTYTATAAAAIHVGATVKFIDSRKDSLEMDYDQMERAITDKTKAVIPVDLGGIPCDYDRIYQAVEGKKALFCPKGDVQEALGRVAVVADCAHGLGASRHGVPTGALADFTSFSFHAVKNFTTAEGGASAWRTLPGLDDEELYHHYQLLSLHGQSKDALAKTKLGAWEYDIVGPWYKCNMTDIMAAIGLAQLHRYEELLAKRYALVEQYHELLASTAIRPARHLTEDGRSSCHLYLTELEGKTLSQRNAVIDALAQQGIASNVHYKPLPLLTAYRDLGFRMEDYPNAYGLYERELTLPLYSTLTQAQAERICGALREIL